MKVVFLEDVPDVGEVGQVKEVADGYGRNYLLPRKLAALANSMASNIVEVQLKKKVRRQAEIEAEMKKLAKQLEGKEVVLKARAGEKDRLYGSITSADIADELNSISGLEVDKRKIELAEPIRQLGSYEVTIRLTKDIIPAIKVTVIAEEPETEKEKEKPEVKKRKKKADKTEALVEETKGETEAEVKVEEVKAAVEVEVKKPEAKKRKKKAEKAEAEVEEVKAEAEEVKAEAEEVKAEAEEVKVEVEEVKVEAEEVKVEAEEVKAELEVEEEETKAD